MTAKMMSIAPDTILVDRYHIREQLSQKAGRLTFLADDLQLQKLVIVKILRFDSDFQWDDLKLFEREALTLKNLDHPAIPKYLDYFDLEAVDIRGFALVQTYIKAPSLESIIKSGQKFSESEVIELADRLLSILTYLHEQLPPVIHRDIKPSNILLNNRSGNQIGDVYLVDFGSVQTAVSKEDGTITIVGTYGYIPLEQFGGQTTIASDLYSLGMTLIYLITGTHPAGLPYVNGQIKFNAEISNRLHRWLEKMTQPHLDKRFDSDRSAQAALMSNDRTYGDFTSLKPARCKSKLYRDRELLEIILPRRVLKIDSVTNRKIKDTLDFISGLGCLLLVAVFFTLFFVNFTMFGNLLGLSIFIFFLGCIVVSMIGEVLNRTKKYWIDSHYKLVINNESIWVSDRTIYQRNIDRILSIDRRSEFDSVVYNPGYSFNEYIDGDSRVVKRGYVSIKPELQIYCESSQYLIGDNLSQAELYWLGQEVSDFLNLELQIIYPTPKAPPEPSSHA
jgi:serine/threonine protein kinase